LCSMLSVGKHDRTDRLIMKAGSTTKLLEKTKYVIT
jgi:hypothetical protein